MAKKLKNPAERVYAAFGGAMGVHRATGIPQQEVYRWNYSKAKKGCDGRVPHQHQRKILDAAKRLKIALAPADLVDTP